MKNKIILSLLLVCALATPFLAKAITIDELKAQVASLQAQISQLLLAQIAQTQGSATTSWCYTFNINLGIGSSGNEVVNLHTALQKQGFTGWSIANVFDKPTASAVVRFQEKYASEILAPYGLKYGTGFVGTTTRAKLNKLYGCSPAAQTQQLSFQITTDKAIYNQTDNIVIKVRAKNNSSQNATLNFPSSYQSDYIIDGIFRLSAGQVFAQALSSITIAPLETKEWSFTHSWRKYILAAGTHIIKGELVGYGSSTATITIAATTSQIYFTYVMKDNRGVIMPNTRFVVKMTDLSKIQQALNDLNGLLPHHLIVSGIVKAGDGGFNSPWHWHLDPATIVLGDFFIELCDGGPSDPEGGTLQSQSWIGMQFCPWGGYVESVSDNPTSTILSAEFVKDNFTDIAGKTLALHTGDKGATWTKHKNYVGDTVIDNAGRIRNNYSGSGSVYYASGRPSSADYYVKGDVTLLSSAGDYFSIAGRMSTSTNTFYEFGYSNLGSYWFLRKLVNGSPTLLTKLLEPFGSVGTTHFLKLSMEDSTISGYVDGALKLSATDVSITSAGVAGVVSNGLVSDTTGQHLDSFTAGGK